MIKEIKQQLVRREKIRRKDLDDKYYPFHLKEICQAKVLEITSIQDDVEFLEKKYAQPLTAEWLRENGKRWGFVESTWQHSKFTLHIDSFTHATITINKNDKAKWAEIHAVNRQAIISASQEITIGEFINIMDLLQFEEEEI